MGQGTEGQGYLLPQGSHFRIEHKRKATAMTTVEKIANVRTRVGNDIPATDEDIAASLDDAKEAILARRYPFKRPSNAQLPDQYENAQVKLAARYILRKGAEGEKAHNEDGVNRTYGSVNDEDILMEIMQIAKVG